MRRIEDIRSASLCGALPVVLRMLVGAAVLLPVAIVWGETLVSGWLNAYQAVFACVADDFKLLSLNMDHEGVDRVLRARVTWRHIVIVGDTVIYPDPRGVADASTLMAHALQGPLTALLAAIAWPLRERDLSLKGPGAWLEWTVRGAMLVPLLAIVVLTDMPLVLAGELWAMVLEALDPDAISALVLWKSFLQGGGRFALGVAAGVSAVVAARWLCRLFHARFARTAAADRA